MKKYSNKILIGYIALGIIILTICIFTGIHKLKTELQKHADTTDIYDTANVQADTAASCTELPNDTAYIEEV